MGHKMNCHRRVKAEASGSRTTPPLLPDIKWFLDRVRIGKFGECWHWKLTPDPHGYGRLRFKRRNHYAHRIAYALFVGPIPDGLLIRHLCGCAICVNPSHLAPGTDSQNAADTEAMGRVCRGERSWMAKLNDAKVKEIRRRHNILGEPITSLAREYGIDRSTASVAARGKTWKHVI